MHSNTRFFSDDLDYCVDLYTINNQIFVKDDNENRLIGEDTPENQKKAKEMINELIKFNSEEEISDWDSYLKSFDIIYVYVKAGKIWLNDNDNIEDWGKDTPENRQTALDNARNRRQEYLDNYYGEVDDTLGCSEPEDLEDFLEYNSLH